jgi:hypothetical protein
MIGLPYGEMTYKFSMQHKIIACIASASLTTIRLERLLSKKKKICVANIVDIDFRIDQQEAKRYLRLCPTVPHVLPFANSEGLAVFKNGFSKPRYLDAPGLDRTFTNTVYRGS